MRDNLREILSRILRIPVGGRPITIIDLSAVPFLDSTGAHVLEGLARKAHRRHVRFTVAGANPEVPHGLPVVPDSLKPWLSLVTRGAEKASAGEIASNPRSRSAILRIAERTAAPWRAVA